MLRTLPTGCRNWDRQSACPCQHARKTADGWQPGDDTDWGLLQTANGRAQWYGVCATCGHRSSVIPNRVIDMWIADGTFRPERFVYARTNPPREYPPCAVVGCSQPGAELHHFAPVNTFGWLEAETWPKADLCLQHHHAWHRRMDGYRRHARGIAS